MHQSLGVACPGLGPLPGFTTPARGSIFVGWQIGNSI